jgi:hypothetical protein
VTDQFKRLDESSGYQVQVPMSVIRDVRSMVSDYAQTNETHEGEESSDEKIGRYIHQVVSDFNGTPPVFRAGIEPMALLMPMAGPVRALIITGASARLLRSIMIKLARNDVPYTANNVSIQRNAVWRNLQPLVSEMQQEYEQKKLQLKQAANVAGGWGGTGGAGGIDAMLTTPDGGWRAMLTDQYGGRDLESVFITI